MDSIERLGGSVKLRLLIELPTITVYANESGDGLRVTISNYDEDSVSFHADKEELRILAILLKALAERVK